jgi:hypothetical protein
MSGKREYHIRMKIGLAPAVLVGLLVPPLLFVTSSHAQVNGAPTSVTSPGFGGRPVNGPPASVTSVGPQGYAPPFRTGTPGTVPLHHHSRDGQHGQHNGKDHNFNGRDKNFAGPVYYAVPVPYAVDGAPGPDDEAYANDDADHQGGPTVFDRRGSGDRSYVAPERDAAPAHGLRDDAAPARSQQSEMAPPAAEPAPDPEPEPLDPTVLVFKDGHKLEVENYAIVGPSIFDLSERHRHKIAIADLDIPATRKANDERGVVFQLPPSAKKN